MHLRFNIQLISLRSCLISKTWELLLILLVFHIQYQDNGTLFVNQTKYDKELLNKARMDNCKLAPTPSKPHTQVYTTEGLPLEDPTFCKSLVGALQYLTFTRPDISHVANVVCQ